MLFWVIIEIGPHHASFGLHTTILGNARILNSPYMCVSRHDMHAIVLGGDNFFKGPRIFQVGLDTEPVCEHLENTVKAMASLSLHLHNRDAHGTKAQVEYKSMRRRMMITRL